MAEGDDDKDRERGDKPDPAPAPETTSPGVASEAELRAPEPKPEAPSSPSIAELVQGQVGEIAGAQADVLREKMAHERPIYEGMQRQLDEDNARIKRQFKATRASAEKLQPWDYERQRERFTTDPLSAFGSVGSVFGIIASAFTHQPMTNALNASAAAMNAIHKNDDAEYERANKAWDDNMNLAAKRHAMEHQSYQDAIQLMRNDYASGEAKLKMSAAQYNDKQLMALLDAGLSEEAFKLIDSRNRAVTSAIETSEQIRDIGLAETMVRNMTPTKEQEPDPTKRFAAEMQARQAVHMMQNDKDPRWGVYGQWWANQTRETGQDPSWEEKQQKLDQLGLTHKYGFGAGGGVMTEGREKTQELIRRTAAYEGDPQSETFNDHQASRAKAVEELNREAARGRALTPNRADMLFGLAQKADSSVEIIDKIERLLKRNGFITGLGGRARRGAEVVTDWFGGDTPQAREFERYIQELRLQAPRLLTESLGRPLTAEETRINTIIPGLEFGSTKTYTSRALLDLRERLQTLAGQWRSRAANEPRDKPPPSSRKTTTGKEWYESVPDRTVSP